MLTKPDLLDPHFRGSVVKLSPIPSLFIKESSLSKIHPIYRPNTIRNTSIDVVPPKRNIFSKTIVDIGSTHMGVPYETIMLQLSIIFFPPVRPELVRISPKVGSDRTGGKNIIDNYHFIVSYGTPI